MTTDSLRWEYTARLNRVINYIDEHLDEPLSLQELAQVAAFSPFHFHRIFKALTGETLGAFVWRLRLERAANLLLWQPTTRVTDLPRLRLLLPLQLLPRVQGPLRRQRDRVPFRGTTRSEPRSAQARRRQSVDLDLSSRLST